MTEAEHRARHRYLHQLLDELIADWIMHTKRRPSQSTVLELIQWSATQVEKPDS